MTSAGVAAVVPPKSPISQNSMPLTCASGARVSSNAITAPHPAATTTPVSSSRVVVQGARSAPVRASPNTSSVEASAPPSAAGVTNAVTPASMAPSAPTAAPPEMPRMYGIGKRIAQERLHQRAGQREEPADGERRERARQPQFAHDGGFGFGRSPLVSARRIVTPSSATLPTARAMASAASAATAERRKDDDVAARSHPDEMRRCGHEARL